MRPFKQIFDKRSPYSFFLKFLLLFSVLYFFFPFYWGVTGEGGSFYSPFLNRHFNFIHEFTTFLTSSANVLLRIAGYSTHQNEYNILRINTSRGVIVNPSCLGWGVLSFWVAFVFANTAIWKYRLRWMIIGVVCITCLNIFRIALIVLANHLDWHLITNLDHHQTFNIVSYCCIFLLMYLYVNINRKRERKIQNITHAKDRLNTI